jgi:hypothetical protein
MPLRYRNPNEGTSGDQVSENLDLNRINISIFICHVSKCCPRINLIFFNLYIRKNTGTSLLILKPFLLKKVIMQFEFYQAISRRMTRIDGVIHFQQSIQYSLVHLLSRISISLERCSRKVSAPYSQATTTTSNRANRS